MQSGTQGNRVAGERTQELTCKFCERTFQRENSLASHMCEVKRRMLLENDKPYRMAFNIWREFMKLSIPNTKKERTYEDFARNRYFKDFVKFAKHVIDLNAMHPEEFVRFVVKNSIKLNDWCKDWVYEHYVRELNKRETVDRAVERSLLSMQAWALETGKPWQNFFKDISGPRAVQLIKTGRISPWVLFATPQGQGLLTRLEPGQFDTVAEYIEPDVWRVRMYKNAEECRWINNVFEESGVQ